MVAASRRSFPNDSDALGQWRYERYATTTTTATAAAVTAVAAVVVASATVIRASNDPEYGSHVISLKDPEGNW